MASTLTVPYSLHAREIFTFVFGIGLTTLAVSARIYTKIWLTRLMQPEDYVCILAWLGLLAYVGLCIAVVQNYDDVLYRSYLAVVVTVTYGPVLVLAKISILLQYISLFAPHREGKFYRCCQLVIWANVLYYATTMFLVIFDCTPREALWNHAVPGRCIDQHMFQIYSASLDIVSDFTILLLPLPRIWGLKLVTGKKAGIYGIFVVGVFACMTSIACLVSATIVMRTAEEDPAFPFALDSLGLWSILETSSCLLVGCLPVLPRFFRQFFLQKKNAQSWEKGAPRTKSSWRRVPRGILSRTGSSDYNTNEVPSLGGEIATSQISCDESEISSSSNSQSQPIQECLYPGESELPQVPLPVRYACQSCVPSGGRTGEDEEDHARISDWDIEEGWPLRM